MRVNAVGTTEDGITIAGKEDTVGHRSKIKFKTNNSKNIFAGYLFLDS